MASEESSSRIGSMSVHDAFHRLADRIDHATVDTDPAPWFEVDPDAVQRWGAGNPAGYVRWVKRDHAAARVLTQALIAGELSAHASKGHSTFDVAAWMWSDTWLDRRTYPDFRLHIRGLDPEEWQAWHDARLFLNEAAFNQWLSSQDFSRLQQYEEMRPAIDADERPSPTAFRLPPETPFVSLSEALSWIAFGISLEVGRLCRALKAEELGSDAPSRLAAAVRQLALHASDGGIKARGRYVANQLSREEGVDTKDIEPAAFSDFLAFHPAHDGLMRGTGILWGDEPYAFERILGDVKSDEYRSVLVRRADLMRTFEPTQPPAHGNSHAASVNIEPPSANAALPQPYSDEERRSWMRECAVRNADKAHALFKGEPRYDGTKQAEWRTEWRNVRNHSRGRPKKFEKS